MNTWLRKWLRECGTWEYRTYGRTGFEILRGPGIVQQSKPGAEIDAIQGGFEKDMARMAFARNPHDLPFGYRFDNEFADFCISIQVTAGRVFKAIRRGLRNSRKARELASGQFRLLHPVNWVLFPVLVLIAFGFWMVEELPEFFEDIRAGAILRGSELKLTGQIPVDTYNGVAESKDLYREMRNWLQSRIEQGNVD